MEQSIQTASFIYGLISLVTLIVFFVMANNVSIMTDQISQIKKSLNRPGLNINVEVKEVVEDPEARNEAAKARNEAAKARKLREIREAEANKRVDIAIIFGTISLLLAVSICLVFELARH